MLYRCIPAAHRPATLRAPAKVVRKANRPFTVDIHCHVLTPAADTLVQPVYRPETDALIKFANEATREVNRRQGAAIRDRITSIETRLSLMDEMGIDVQAISPAPSQYFYWTEPELGREAARLINDNIATIAQGHPDRFVGLGTVPLQAPELAVAELERMVKELGLRGVEIATNVEGADLSDARFRPFFAKAEELGILVFLHPSGFSHGERLADHYFINVIGNPLDSTVAVSHLIFGGVLDAYPRLKVCVAHGGGYLPAYSGRMDHAHAAREDCRRVIKKPPTRHLKKLYFDTIVFTPHQLEYLVQQYGGDHVLLGTDYPYDMGMYDPVGFISGARLGRDDKAAIMGRNAARLLKIKVPATKKAKAVKPAKKTKPAKRKRVAR
jgi:aminocarboxymuconate-semialdehyde decarboxylase